MTRVFHPGQCEVNAYGSANFPFRQRSWRTKHEQVQSTCRDEMHMVAIPPCTKCGDHIAIGSPGAVPSPPEASSQTSSAFSLRVTGRKITAMQSGLPAVAFQTALIQIPAQPSVSGESRHLSADGVLLIRTGCPLASLGKLFPLGQKASAFLKPQPVRKSPAP